MYHKNSSKLSSKLILITFLIILQAILSNQLNVGNKKDRRQADDRFPQLASISTEIERDLQSSPINQEHQDVNEGLSRASWRGEYSQEATKNYTGWHIIRIHSPNQVVLDNVVRSLENNSQIVLLEVVKGKLMMDVALPPDLSLGKIMSDPFSPTLCCLDTEKVRGRGRGRGRGKKGRLWARKKMNSCLEEKSKKENSKDREGKTADEKVVAWETINNFLSPYSTRQLNGTERLAWDDFYRWDSIVRFAKELALNYSTVEYLDIGSSIEGRALFALIFASKPNVLVRKYKQKMLQLARRRESGRGDSTPKVKERKRASKQYVLIEAGAHAREWLSPAVATFAAQKLADAGKKFLKRVSVVLVPMANPDGYEFSHTTDRLWRKNRRSTSKPECKGVDLNRNWAKSWGTSGSSGDPCADTYRGSQSFSEPETRALRDLALVWVRKFTLFVSLHSYGSYVLYPWSHTQTASPDSGPLTNVARKMTKYLRRNGYRDFLYGQTSNTLYQASGTAEDYMITAGIDYDYTFELPGYSFDFDRKKIKSISKAFWDMLVCAIGDIGKQKKIKKFCSQRIVKILLEDGSIYSDWVNKAIPLDEAKEIVRKRYEKKHKDKVNATTAGNGSASFSSTTKGMVL